jgi:enhancing lycopene biosynthesis protein 2
MTVSPRKIGLFITGGNPWEIVFSILQLEKLKLLRLPITIDIAGFSAFAAEVEEELSRLIPVKIEDVKATELDAVIIPGGMRLFRGLCDSEAAGDTMKVDDRLKTLLRGVYRLEKPIGAFGPAVLLVTKALQGIARSGSVVTVGNDPKLQAEIEKSGAQTVATRPGEVVLDETNKLVTSGGELGTRRIGDVNAACENLLSGLTELMIDRK